jgi:UDP-N-acetylmuramoylalanine--D-glutamate ligase
MIGSPHNSQQPRMSQRASAEPSPRTLVLGLGATGLSVARWLQRIGDSAQFADSRDDADTSAITALLPAAEVHTGALHAGLLDGIERLIVSPGITDREPLLVAARERGLPVLTDIDLFAGQARAPVVAITGSNGKSTVTSLVKAMCDAAGLPALAGGNLGTPALDLLNEPVPAFYVLELSSFQLQRTTALTPLVATVLNVSPDHLDWHGSFEQYAAAKQRIYARCDSAIVNLDDPLTQVGIPDTARRIGFTTLVPGAGQYGIRRDAGEDHVALGEQVLMPVSELGLSGGHNVANAVAAFAIGAAIGLPLGPMIRAARAFGGLPHRMQTVAEVGGVRYIDDSKATNPAAALAAIRGVSAPVVLIAGGRSKGGDYAALGAELPEHVKAAVVYGENAAELVAALSAAIPAAERVADLDAAVRRAAEIATEGDVILLAPASASQDMFRDFNERGDRFAAAVERVAK